MEIYAETAMSILDELHTERLDYHSEYVPLADAINRLESYEETGMEPEELAQAAKDGRLVVLPCKVGDTVYMIGASICKWREIDHCEEYCDGWQYRDCWEGTRTILEEKFSLCALESIGKTVFLTREAAEAALDAMGGENNA